MIAPRIDIRNPALSFGPYHPAVRPMKPPINAPAIPSRIVTMNPPGSRPGMTSFAMTPTIRPKTIQPSTPIRHLRGSRRASRATSSVQDIEVLEGAAGIKEDHGFMRLDRSVVDEPPDRGQRGAACVGGTDAL